MKLNLSQRLKASRVLSRKRIRSFSEDDFVDVLVKKLEGYGIRLKELTSPLAADDMDFTVASGGKDVGKAIQEILDDANVMYITHTLNTKLGTYYEIETKGADSMIITVDTGLGKVFFTYV